VNRPLTKDEWLQAIAEDFGAAVSAVYEDEIKAAVEAERRACELACADVADQERDADHIEGFFWAEECIAAIRARGDVPKRRRSSASKGKT